MYCKVVTEYAEDADRDQAYAEFLQYVERTRERSLMEQIASLPLEQREELLQGIDPEHLLYDWKSWARPSQLLPDGAWTTGVIMAGRGYGKTRVGSEWVRDKSRQHPGCRFILLARTAADVRDVMVQGESGILAVHPPSERPEYVPSRGVLVWPNGCTALLMTSEVPSKLRGPQAHFSWADEIGTYSHIPDESGLTAWENLRIATRLGEHPQIITTTTPKRMPAIQDLIDEADSGRSTILVRGRTIDNAANLAASYLETLFYKYHGTHLWKQELEGLMMEGIEGALWTEELINDNRVHIVTNPPLKVIAVDPSVAENPKDECGIVVVGATRERQLHKRHAYIIEDLSVHGSPEIWAKRVVDASKKYGAPIVAEGNQGSELVRMALKGAGAEVPVFLVNARENKQTRAEPVAVAYQAKRVHHIGYFGDLESQLTTWDPADKKRKSPDRLDALVWGVTALLIKPPKGLTFPGPIRAKSQAHKTVPGVRKGAQVTRRAA